VKNSIEVRGVTVAQAPNAPLIVAGVGAVASRVTSGPIARLAGVVSNLGLLAWAYLECTDGVNLFRRALGVSGVLTAVAGLAGSFRSRPEPAHDHHADPQPPAEPESQPPPLPE
jgi:hypothetical protein